MATAQWTMICPRDRHYPVLPLEHRRSAFTNWPPMTPCSRCGTVADGGYTGPVRGERAVLPDPRVVFTCVDCAAAAVGLEPGALGQHCCDDRCTDFSHVDVVPVPAADAAADEAALLAAASVRYRGTAWKVVSVSEAPRSPDTSPDAMAVWLELDADLDWQLADA